MFKTSIWLCADLSGEHVFKSKPIRWKDKPGNLKEMELWVSKIPDEESLNLPKGSIERLIGKNLTWLDDPLELNEMNISKNDIRTQYNFVYNNLFRGGLIHAREIISQLVKETSFDEFELLELIQNRIIDLKAQRSDGVYERENAKYILKKDKDYLCIDNDYKLCIRRMDDEQWGSVKLVFPYISVIHIYSILGTDVENLW